jgi:hypothetical protein
MQVPAQPLAPPPVKGQAAAQVAAAVPAPSSAAAPTKAATPLASVAELLRSPRPSDWRLRRLRDNSAILVIEFPALTEQGHAMNRIAAMFEKRNGSRDRVLTESEMAQLLRRSGDNVATFFQGHDYKGDMLATFFTLASLQRIALNPQEAHLRDLLVEAAVLQPGDAGAYRPLGAQAVISFTAVQADDPSTEPDETVDERRRETVLLHELSHGEFFTNAAYRAHCWSFWRRQLSERERKLFRHYLEGLDYDPRDEELMVNETQAVLMHTPDERAFNAARLGVTEPELARLRARFRPGDPLPSGAAELVR